MKLGLVLAGGGAKGAYQVGVFKGLIELGIDKYIKVISGTSIGALNGVLFNQGNISLSEKLWCELSKEKIFPTDNGSLLRKSILLNIGSKNIELIKKYIPSAVEGGEISREETINIFKTFIDFKKIKKDDILIYATCTSLPKLEAKYFKINNYDEENIIKILLASSALPMIYKNEYIDGEKYLDGGIVDNLPIQPVYGEGCDVIIVIPLSRDYYIDRNMYPNTRIIEIKPSNSTDGFMDDSLDFTKEGATRRISLGYNDAKTQLEPIFKLANNIYENKLSKEENEKNTFLKIFKSKLF